MVDGDEAAHPAMNRRMRKQTILPLHPQPNRNAMNAAIDKWYTIKRPYSSDSGAISKGPSVNPRRKILIVKLPTIAFVWRKSFIKMPEPGAEMVVERLLLCIRSRRLRVTLTLTPEIR
jgi:hypothetical protein